MGLGETIRQSFIEGYQSKANQLQKTLTTDLTMSLPRYKSITWRFDVQVGYRSDEFYLIDHRQFYLDRNTIVKKSQTNRTILSLKININQWK